MEMKKNVNSGLRFFYEVMSDSIHNNACRVFGTYFLHDPFPVGINRTMTQK